MPQESSRQESSSRTATKDAVFVEMIVEEDTPPDRDGPPFRWVNPEIWAPFEDRLPPGCKRRTAELTGDVPELVASGILRDLDDYIREDDPPSLGGRTGPRTRLRSRKGTMESVWTLSGRRKVRVRITFADGRDDA